MLSNFYVTLAICSLSKEFLFLITSVSNPYFFSKKFTLTLGSICNEKPKKFDFVSFPFKKMSQEELITKLVNYTFKSADNYWLRFPFNTQEECAVCRDLVIRDIYDEFAFLNIPECITEQFKYRTTNKFWRKRKQFKNLLKQINFGKYVRYFLLKIKNEHCFLLKDIIVYLKNEELLERFGYLRFKLVGQKLYHILRSKIMKYKLSKHYNDIYKDRLIVNTIDTIFQHVSSDEGTDKETYIKLQGSDSLIDLDEYFSMEYDGISDVFNISSLVPNDIVESRSNPIYTSLYFADSSIKKHNKKIRKFRDKFKCFILKFLPECGFIPDIAKLIWTYSYDEHRKYGNLSKRKIKVKLVYDDNSDDSDYDE